MRLIGCNARVHKYVCVRVPRVTRMLFIRMYQYVSVILLLVRLLCTPMYSCVT